MLSQSKNACLFHPKRVATIKADVEKLLRASFIYPVPLTDWVSNIVYVMKKQGMISIVLVLRTVKPTPFIDQIVDDCAGSKVFSFMVGFSDYNQINILPSDQHKTAFICPWGTFAYRKLPFGLKNVGATFQRVMNYAFHDIKHIVQPCLDDLPSHSKHHEDHPIHLGAIFLHCRHYNIRLNPHKCVFCVQTGRLIGFIVSKQGIRIDPLKVHVILDLSTPSLLVQLQHFQGKASFLRRFLPNYVN